MRQSPTKRLEVGSIPVISEAREPMQIGTWQ
jgi:hypothetical protein